MRPLPRRGTVLLTFRQASCRQQPSFALERASWLRVERLWSRWLRASGLNLLTSTLLSLTFALAAASVLTQVDERLLVRDVHVFGASALACDGRSSAYVGSGTVNCLRG